ncbi:MAG: peptide deformylase [Elusimicrobia bacterium]|nr:peptide deformylase [Elusimicrobiota bacterium]
MKPLAIVGFPHPLLKTAGSRVPCVTPEVLKQLEAMTITMRAHPRCVGLAAPQVGFRERLAVVDVGPLAREKKGTNHGLLQLINPVIRRREGNRTVREGCLSIPDFTANVQRATRVIVQALGVNDQPLTIEAEGFEALVLQHEVDHLNGLLFLDRVSSLVTDVFPRKTYA